MSALATAATVAWMTDWASRNRGTLSATDATDAAAIAFEDEFDCEGYVTDDAWFRTHLALAGATQHAIAAE